MRERRRKFTPEFKDEAVKMVIESSRPVAEVAREIQVNGGTLGNWVHRYRLDHVGEEPPLSISEMSPTGAAQGRRPRCPSGRGRRLSPTDLTPRAIPTPFSPPGPGPVSPSSRRGPADAQAMIRYRP